MAATVVLAAMVAGVAVAPTTRRTPCEVEDVGTRWVAVGGVMLPVAGCGVMPLDDGGAKLPQDDGVTPLGGTKARGRYEEKMAWRSAP